MKMDNALHLLLNVWPAHLQTVMVIINVETVLPVAVAPFIVKEQSHSDNCRVSQGSQRHLYDINGR